MEPFAVPPLLNTAHFRKVNDVQRAPDARFPKVPARPSQVEPELLLFC
jgi:hypothetical protein